MASHLAQAFLQNDMSRGFVIGVEDLNTTRDVVRTVNALRFDFLPVKGQVDPADMLFLQLARTKNDRLFRWIERYVTELSAIGDWGQVAPGDVIRMGSEFLKASGMASAIEKEDFVFRFQEHLPGLDGWSLLS